MITLVNFLIDYSQFSSLSAKILFYTFLICGLDILVTKSVTIFHWALLTKSVYFQCLKERIDKGSFYKEIILQQI